HRLYNDVDCDRPPSAAAPAQPDATEWAPKKAPVKISSPRSNTQRLGTSVSKTPAIIRVINTIKTRDGRYFVARDPAQGEVKVPMRYARNNSDTTETGRLNGSSSRWNPKKLYTATNPPISNMPCRYITLRTTERRFVVIAAIALRGDVVVG